MVYDELRRAAARMLSSERPEHTFNPSDLVHEAWLRLGLHDAAGAAALPATDRSHFLGLAIRAMRFVLIDHARRRLADKRGGGARRSMSRRRMAPRRPSICWNCSTRSRNWE